MKECRVLTILTAPFLILGPFERGRDIKNIPYQRKPRRARRIRQAPPPLAREPQGRERKTGGTAQIQHNGERTGRDDGREDEGDVTHVFIQVRQCADGQDGDAQCGWAIAGISDFGCSFSLEGGRKHSARRMRADRVRFGRAACFEVRSAELSDLASGPLRQ